MVSDMVILESKELLVKELKDAWDKIIQVDKVLEEAINALTAARTEMRSYIKKHNHADH
jgi:hypothetical protein